ncbi:hypothetical protein E4U26_000978 [Claviceps purpurea]|nr:hypothetical protein E4U26_000978 [Claviceps purpurea]
MFSNGIEADEVLIRFWGSSVLAAYVGHVAEGVGRAGWVLGDEAETRALEDEDDNLGKQVSLEADCLTPRAASCRFQRIDEQERVIGQILPDAGHNAPHQPLPQSVQRQMD